MPPGDPLRTSGLPYWPYDPVVRGTSPLHDAPAASIELDGGGVAHVHHFLDPTLFARFGLPARL